MTLLQVQLRDAKQIAIKKFTVRGATGISRQGRNSNDTRRISKDTT